VRSFHLDRVGPVFLRTPLSCCLSLGLILLAVAPAQATIGVQYQMVLGNPSNATADTNDLDHYLIQRDVEALDYNDTLRQPNWASWNLTTADTGSSGRSSNFYLDTNLPPNFYWVPADGYSGSGYDRGHMCPSGDRTSSIATNSATFLMTNMMPQAPDNNQGPWEQLEEYERTLANAGNELYIYAAGAGQGGTGSNGAAHTVASSHVVVPAFTWKIIVVLPNGDNDADRVGKTTRVIAVIMPNVQGIRSTPWQNFKTNVREIEKLTGLNFFTNVRPQMRFFMKNRVDQQ